MKIVSCFLDSWENAWDRCCRTARAVISFITISVIWWKFILFIFIWYEFVNIKFKTLLRKFYKLYDSERVHTGGRGERDYDNWGSQSVNKSPKLVILHMGHLIMLNVASWNDFCHTKNLKIPPPPIIRCGLIEAKKWLNAK